MARSSNGKNDFAGPAQKYVGKIGVLGGVIPLQQWHRPYLKNQHEAYDQQGVDLRPERPVKKGSTPAEVKRHDRDRQKGGG